jgi:NADPH:quinone reductase-like Zn-dependent oxidoreductase
VRRSGHLASGTALGTAIVKILQYMAEAARDGKLRIPISQKFPRSDAGEAHSAAEKGAGGKILLVV